MSPISDPRGSIWRKWDLHVHTPESTLAHSFGSDWPAYVAKLIEAINKHGISAIATADYFTIKGYRKLLEFYDPSTCKLTVGSASANVLIIPGVELRLNVFNSAEESINLHVFFDPELCSPDFIDQHFLEELKVTFRDKDHPLKNQALLAIGKSIVTGADLAVGEDFTATNESEKATYRKKALGTITLYKRDIAEALKAIDEIFESQKVSSRAYLVAIVGKGRGGINALKWFEDNRGTQFSRSGLVREDLTHQADLIFSNDQNDRLFYLGKNPTTPGAEIRERFKNLKPCVWGSDGNDFQTLLHPSRGNTLDYTWIKADVSFEGLRQITYEPELRVRVQEDDPGEREAYAKIENLEVNFPNDLRIKDKESGDEMNFCIQGTQTVSFSANLTCIIGGRGSGKSTLVHLLYNATGDAAIQKLNEINSPLTDLQLGAREVLAKVRSLTKADVPAKTEFFLQNEVEKFARDVSEMSKLIRARLFALSALDEAGHDFVDLELTWDVAAGECDKLIDAFDNLAELDRSIGELERKKATLQKQTDVITSTEYKELQSEVAKCAAEISGFATYEKENREILSEIANLIESAKALDWTKLPAQEILNALVSGLETKSTQLSEALAAAKQTYDAAKWQGRLKENTDKLKAFLREKGLSPENVVEVAAASQQIIQWDDEIKLLQRSKKPHEDLWGRKDEILGAYREAYGRYKGAYENVTTLLQKRLGDLRFDDQDTKISFELQENEQALKTKVVEFIKRNKPAEVSLRADFTQDVIFGVKPGSGIPICDLVADPEKIVEAVNNSGRADIHTKILQELLSNKGFQQRLHLEMQRSCYDIENIQVQTKLGEKSLQNTSFGERCGIVIAIALVAGTNPIVIDQPEDNLDGKYISNVLVLLLREQKLKRQIILVTRDANIVIGGDAELIIILKKESGGTGMLPATIENKVRRPEYIWILDGGETAFRNREAKYSI